MKYRAQNKANKYYAEACPILTLVQNQVCSYIMYSSDGLDYLNSSQTINSRLKVRDENIPRGEH